MLPPTAGSRAISGRYRVPSGPTAGTASDEQLIPFSPRKGKGRSSGVAGSNGQPGITSNDVSRPKIESSSQL
jgi:hypothetical protein